MGSIAVPTGQKTAAQLVQLAMDLAHIFDNTVFRTGFSSDPDTTGTSILGFLNLAQDDILPTGYCKCYFALNLAEDQQEYGLAPEVGEILDVRIDGETYSLTPVTRLGEDVRDPAWNGGSANGVPDNLPTKYYAVSDMIGFVPCPDQVYTALIFADSVPPSLVNTGDVPARLPARSHKLLAIKAAIYICNADAENPAAKERMNLLMAEFNIGYQELESLVRSRLEAISDHLVVEDYRSRSYGYRGY